MQTLKDVAKAHRFAVVQPAAVAARNADQQAALDADEALNRNKVERADARAAFDQAMLNTLLGSSL